MLVSKTDNSQPDRD